MCRVWLESGLQHKLNWQEALEAMFFSHPPSSTMQWNAQDLNMEDEGKGLALISCTTQVILAQNLNFYRKIDMNYSTELLWGSHRIIYMNALCQLHTWYWLKSQLTIIIIFMAFQPEPPSSSNSPKWPTQRERGGAPATCSLGLLKNMELGFPGGTVVENLPANAGDTGSSPGLGRSHMPWSN